MITYKSIKSIGWRVLLVAAVPMALALPAAPAQGDLTPTTALVLSTPKDLPDVPALPFTGTKMASFTTPETMANLDVSPQQGPEGTPITITGKGLTASTSYTLTWSTADGAWMADVQPNTVNYVGTKYTKYSVELASVTTDANGGFTFQTSIPRDFGGVHDIYAVASGVAAAHGGFQMNPSMSISPTSGPVGTPITVTYTGMGPNLYTGGVSVLWDNSYAGEAQALWTRGTAKFVIRASGEVGTHYVASTAGIGVQYMNIKQSPVPFAKGTAVAFKVTKDAGAPASYIDWPAQVTPTVTQKTTLSDVGLDPNTKAVATLSNSSGPILSKVHLNVSGLSSDGNYQVVWSTVVGNRVNCTGTCWVFNALPMSTATAKGGSISQDVTIPDNLGGWHVIQIKQGDVVEAQVPFYVKESIMPYYDKAGKVISMGLALADKSNMPEDRNGSGTPTMKFKAGQEFTVAIKGVGWTQLDNTLAVTYDNSYIGYGCGFNSNGYMVVHLIATGAPGTHLIDLHPVLYTNQPSFANTPYGMLPVLTNAHDLPGLALGYQPPAIHMAITIVK